jgi:predicted nucleotidyltransferase
MIQIINFEPRLVSTQPATQVLLAAANLTVHPAVERVILHGSRGPAGGWRPDSDIDLSLIVDAPGELNPAEMEAFFQAVIETTMGNWRAAIQPDLAVVFDIRDCGPKCFERETWSDEVCTQGGLDCFGLYKTQKEFNGLVTNAGVRVRRMYPCLKIWERGCTPE